MTTYRVEVEEVAHRAVILQAASAEEAEAIVKRWFDKSGVDVRFVETSEVRRFSAPEPRVTTGGTA